MPKIGPVEHETAVVDVQNAARLGRFHFFVQHLDRELQNRRVAVDDDAPIEPVKIDFSIKIADPAHRNLIRERIGGLKIEPRVHQNKLINFKKSGQPAHPVDVFVWDFARPVGPKTGKRGRIAEFFPGLGQFEVKITDDHFFVIAHQTTDIVAVSAHFLDKINDTLRVRPAIDIIAEQKKLVRF